MSSARWRESRASRPGDKLLAVTTISFDIAALELFLPLVAGGQVEVAPASELPDGFALRQEAGAVGPHCHAGDARDVGDADRGGVAGRSRPSGIVWRRGDLTCARRWIADARKGGLERLWPHGDDDLVVVASASGRASPITIGRPIANTQFYVVDRSGNPVPIGVPGELLVGGDGLARGYFRRPGVNCGEVHRQPVQSRAWGAALQDRGLGSAPAQRSHRVFWDAWTIK